MTAVLSSLKEDEEILRSTFCGHTTANAQGMFGQNYNQKDQRKKRRLTFLGSMWADSDKNVVIVDIFVNKRRYQNADAASQIHRSIKLNNRI